ncbi:hypothetical protein [Roseateles toxinivorans]|uniref:Outer membrane beta-barrel porin/alpha-amylase n=1 Tax=Roseateles toxinivorans TaxID=270368 RepID=A0A4R6QSK4_9BURK|nr:hypothetical protein [Roseateles toxinivorans]TDP74033.1 hypothetical protein DES47_10179 [Roseateles toxinivorans]
MALRLTLLCAVAGICSSPSVWAGRPLSSDDAATADPGTCQVESWLERQGGDRTLVIAPACGIAPGMELAADYSTLHPRDVLHAGAGLAFKWVPETWAWDTPAGAVQLGLKLSASWLRPSGTGWQHSELGALGLLTLQPHEDWALHANLGRVRERSSGSGATLLNLALSWTPTEQAQLFAETLANNRRQVFGGTVNTVGGRWWLLKDVLGLDLTASREAGSGARTVWSLGFGWYGLRLP